MRTIIAVNSFDGVSFPPDVELTSIRISRSSVLEFCTNRTGETGELLALGNAGSGMTAQETQLLDAATPVEAVIVDPGDAVVLLTQWTMWAEERMGPVTTDTVTVWLAARPPEAEAESESDG